MKPACHDTTRRMWCDDCATAATVRNLVNAAIMPSEPIRRIAFDFRVELSENAPPTIDPGAAYLRAVG